LRKPAGRALLSLCDWQKSALDASHVRRAFSLRTTYPEWSVNGRSGENRQSFAPCAAPRRMELIVAKGVDVGSRSPVLMATVEGDSHVSPAPMFGTRMPDVCEPRGEGRQTRTTSQSSSRRDPKSRPSYECMEGLGGRRSGWRLPDRKDRWGPRPQCKTRVASPTVTDPRSAWPVAESALKTQPTPEPYGGLINRARGMLFFFFFFCSFFAEDNEYVLGTS